MPSRRFYPTADLLNWQSRGVTSVVVPPPPVPQSIAWIRARAWSTFQSNPDLPPVDPPPSGTDITPTAPTSYATLAAAITGLGTAVPADIRSATATMSDGSPVYVTWDVLDITTTLEEMFLSMKDGQVLVLKERAAAWEYDTADGFRAAGVVSVTNNGVVTPIASSYKGKGARTWFAMCRARRGILALGPGVKIKPRASSFSRPQQARPAQSFYTTSDGVNHTITGCQEKLIEIDGKAANNNAIFANFELYGGNFGEMAYHGLSGVNTVTFAQLKLIGASRGFDVSPNGEAGALCMGAYIILDVEIDGRDATSGVAVGSSPIMSNSGPSGVVDRVLIHHMRMGGPAIYKCRGNHLWKHYDGPAFNHEANYGRGQGDFTFEIQDSTIRGTTRQSNVRSPFGSQVIIIRNCVIGTANPTFNCWSSGTETRTQLRADCHAYDAAGNPLTITTGGSFLA